MAAEVAEGTTESPPDAGAGVDEVSSWGAGGSAAGCPVAAGASGGGATAGAAYDG